ncbi:MAG TPA: MarR family winged helix-turn-helix transcriptional regulator [Phototrophicaceae bacterium]|nr:MarR family winged helix-turn-helix transcriptional regulator [Phototrophicaceae bacterium]
MSIESDGWQFNVELTHLHRDIMWITEQATGMSQTRLDILHELYHADELSQADLQQRLGVEGPVITRIVKQMEAEGQVTRRPDPRDNRYTLVAMTDEIRQARASESGLNFRDTLAVHLMQGLSEEERADLLRLIRIVGANARAFRDSGSAGSQ